MGLSIDQLTSIHSVKMVDEAFIKFLSPQEKKLLTLMRDEGMTDEGLLQLAEVLERFLVSAFALVSSYKKLQAGVAQYDVLSIFYQEISKPVLRKRKIEDINLWAAREVHTAAVKCQEDELKAIQTLKAQFDHDALTAWCQYIVTENIEPFIHWQVFNTPKKMDFANLVKVTSYKPRFDYRYIGPTLSAQSVERQVSYCIDCHYKDNDSCKKGLWDRGKNTYKVSVLGRVLTGCPLNQKISQMHVLRKRKKLIASLAVIMIDNPLCVVTGDRICNDCMAACIYQKFEPVDTPSVESNTLAQVLSLPYGAEIYLLLARWNPLKEGIYSYQETQKGRVAVVGMGPAGFAMSYYLLLSGAQVVGFDGLSIRKEVGEVYTPIKSFYGWVSEFLSQGPLAFGGVVDYGITARWNKELIALVWVLLHRFPKFHMMGNMRLGGALTLERLAAIGFDQVVLATGAGLPQAHDLQKHKGMLFANEFLMKLQISGMMHKTLTEGLQLPLVVVGGGLTGIDAATEAQVYYLKWVQQVAFWCDAISYEALTNEISDADKEVVKTWREHGQLVREYRQLGELDKVQGLVQAAGGVSIVYRKAMQESPAYKANYLEVEKALEQGISYQDNHNPVAANVCSRGRVKSLVCDHKGIQKTIAAKTVIFATGSKPNIAYYYEHRTDIMVENGYYKRHSNFTAVSDKYPDFVHVVGDLHPEYQGSVVGALASAKDAHRAVHAKANSQEILDIKLLEKTFMVVITGIQVKEPVIELSLQAELPLPIGSYLKLALYDDNKNIISIRAVVISQETAMLSIEDQGSEWLLANRIAGVLGPSGTRLIGKDIPDVIFVVSDQLHIIWALAVCSSAKEKGCAVHLFTEGKLPSWVKRYFTSVRPVEELQGSVDESLDVYYCLSANELKGFQQQGIIARMQHAIVDGPMMCNLKGICGQCIQWQIGEDGKQLKAVYACSWPSQPIHLVDCDHLDSRHKQTIDTTFYRHWERVKKMEK